MLDTFKSEQVRKISKDLLEKLVGQPADLEAMVDVVSGIESGKIIGQGFSLTESELDGVMGLASMHYQSGRYEDAARLYSFVALMNHLDIRAFKGAAMCLQKLGFHAEALQCLGVALLQAPDNQELAQMASESFVLTGDTEKAQDIIERLKTAGGYQ
jgi:tetratricopeptide (TPR) repeat protein